MGSNLNKIKTVNAIIISQETGIPIDKVRRSLSKLADMGLLSRHGVICGEMQYGPTEKGINLVERLKSK